MTEREIERWTREVAENPGAPSFVKLARAYRSQGRREAARDVVLQGLEHNPEHLDAHGLLALIYVEDGEREKAGDEWQTVLRLDPGNFTASRGLGFLALERGDLAAARRHLETAADARPDDPAVEQALQVLERREGAEDAESAEGPPTADRRPPSAASGTPASASIEGADTSAAEGAESGTQPSIRDPESAGPRRSAVGEPRSDGEAAPRDPSRLFDVFSDETPFLGAVVLDEQGLLLAGDIQLEGARGELLGALINTAVAEARRTTDLLGLGGWDGMTLECDEATLHVAGLPDGATVLLAVAGHAPAGWAVRTAQRARELALGFLEAYV